MCIYELIVINLPDRGDKDVEFVLSKKQIIFKITNKKSMNNIMDFLY